MEIIPTGAGRRVKNNQLLFYKKRAARWNTSRGSPNSYDNLRYAKRGKRWLVDY